MGDETKDTVKFWAMPEVSLVAAWVSTAAVLLVGVGVVVAIMGASAGDSPGPDAAQPVLTPAPASVGVSELPPAPGSPPVSDVPPAPVPAGPPVTTPVAVPPVAATPRPDSTVPTPKPEPAVAETPVEQRPVRHRETTSWAASDRNDQSPGEAPTGTARVDGRADDAPELDPWSQQIPQRQQVRSRDEMQRRLGRSVCAQWGIPADTCDEAIQRQQQSGR